GRGEVAPQRAPTRCQLPPPTPNRVSQSAHVNALTFAFGTQATVRALRSVRTSEDQPRTGPRVSQSPNLTKGCHVPKARGPGNTPPCPHELNAGIVAKQDRVPGKTATASRPESASAHRPATLLFAAKGKGRDRKRQ